MHFWSIMLKRAIGTVRIALAWQSVFTPMSPCCDDLLQLLKRGTRSMHGPVGFELYRSCCIRHKRCLHKEFDLPQGNSTPLVCPPELEFCVMPARRTRLYLGFDYIPHMRAGLFTIVSNQMVDGMPGCGDRSRQAIVALPCLNRWPLAYGSC